MTVPWQIDWGQAPAGWDWLAQDEDGRWYWYAVEPVLLGAAGGVWRSNSRNQRLAGQGGANADWMQSLQRRPEAAAGAPDLAQALRALLQAQTGAPVAHVQTHLSHLLLTRELAYKLKKPLRLPFVDFSSVDARRHFCSEELRLNRRLAPSLYLDMLPVLGSVQSPRLGAAGARAEEAIDWVLVMRRFPTGSEADALVRAGTLQADEVERFGRALARFHAQAPAAPEGSDWGRAAQLRQTLDALWRTLEALLDEGEKTRLAAPAARLQGLEPLWQARRARGHVREVHGDLHLGNVVRLAGVLTAFDCIEFDPALRWTDTLADVAFFTMDLHAHGRSDLAWGALDAYLAESGDWEGVALLRPYEVYRALVRAMTARLRAAQGAPAAAGPDYLRCAQALAAPMAPRLLITHGLSGSGKSTLARALLAAAGALRLRSDVERKRLHGLAPLADSAAQGVDIYTPEAGALTFSKLLAQSRSALQAGYPVIVDAAFLRRAEREAFAALARELGLPFAIAHCHADAAQLRARVQARRARGDDASEADLAVLARQQQVAEPLTPAERAVTLDVDTGARWDAHALDRRWRALGTGLT